MGQYRMIVKHVAYWRGEIHKWSNSFQFQGTAAAPTATDCQTLLTAVKTMCFSDTSSSAAFGGAYECVAYNASGGAPLATYVAFDWTTPATWIPYNSTAWPSAGTVPDSSLEVALLVEWPAGLSSTGKPVQFRKWFHAVPQSTAAAPGQVDIASAKVTALTAAAVTLTNCLASSHLLLSTGARYAGTPVVSPYYANHQMPKGRKRKLTKISLSGGSGFTIDPEQRIEGVLG